MEWDHIANEICEFLVCCGYAWFSIRPDGILQVAALKASYGYENLVAVPREKVTALSLI